MADVQAADAQRMRTQDPDTLEAAPAEPGAGDTEGASPERDLTAMTSPDMLAERYGRRSDPDQTRRRAMVALVVLVALGVAFAAWLAAARSQGNVSWTEFTTTVSSDTSATLDFQLTLPSNRKAICTVRALNEGGVEVGRRDVTLGPAESGQIRTQVTLRTTERATSGDVKACVLT